MLTESAPSTTPNELVADAIAKPAPSSDEQVTAAVSISQQDGPKAVIAYAMAMVPACEMAPVKNKFTAYRHNCRFMIDSVSFGLGSTQSLQGRHHRTTQIAPINSKAAGANDGSGTRVGVSSAFGSGAPFNVVALSNPWKEPYKKPSG
jgi:hypothetical protein